MYCPLTRVGFWSSRLLHTDIDSFLPISFKSLLIHVYHVWSVAIFCIDRALPVHRVRVIRKSSRYAIEFDNLLIPCQFTGQIDRHALVRIECSMSLANGALGLGVWSFRVNTSFGTPDGTRRINMSKSEVNEDNYVPVDKDKLKDDQKA